MDVGIGSDMNVYKQGEWVIVSPFTGKNTDKVFIAVGDKNLWIPAYIDVQDNKKVAKIRLPVIYMGQTIGVWLRINSVIARVGRVAA